MNIMSFINLLLIRKLGLPGIKERKMVDEKRQAEAKKAVDVWRTFYETDFKKMNQKDLRKNESYAEVVAREAEWRHGIFHGLEQIEIDLEGYPLRTPTRYVRSDIVAALFPGKTRALKKLIPDHPELRPLTIVPGITPLILTVCDNIDTDHGPNHSFMVIIPIKDPRHIGDTTPFSLIPGWELMRQQFIDKRIHAYLVRLGSDSWNSIEMGHGLYGMSKFRAYTKFTKGDGYITSEVSDDDGHMFTLRAKEIKHMINWNRPEKGMHTTGYNMKDRQLCWLDVLMQPIAMGINAIPGDIEVDFSPTHAFADEFRRIALTMTPLGYMIASEGHTLYEPSRIPPREMARFMTYYDTARNVDTLITSGKVG
jgi:hypothetical protein